MFCTVGEVKRVAGKVWPDADSFYIQPIHRTVTAPKKYQITAFDGQHEVLERMSALTLNELRTLLEARFARPVSVDGSSP
jgi:hypothetical protein